MQARRFIMIGLSWTLSAGAGLAQEPATLSGPTTIFGTGGLTAGMHGTGPLVGGGGHTNTLVVVSLNLGYQF